MNAPASVSILTNALVHRSAIATPAARQRHAAFILQRFAITAGVLALAPFFLAFRGAPTGVETLVFACAFAPLAAAVLVARTGQLGWAHGVAVAGLVGLALTLWLALGCGAACALAWLVAAQLEASLARGTRLPFWTAAANGGLALLILSVGTDGAGAADTVVSSAFAALALAYAVIVSASLGREVAVTPTRPAETFAWLAHPELIDGLVVGLDARGSVIEASGGATIGLMPDGLSGRGLFEHVHVADRPAFLQTVDDAAQRTDTITTRIRIRRQAQSTESCAAGSHIWVEMRATRLAAAPAPESAAVVAVLRAIVAPTPAAPPTTPAIPADIGHELRTPLNAIVGFSEMLASRTLRPTDIDKQFEYARIVHQSGRQLLGVVNAMLDASRTMDPPGEAKPFDLFPSVPTADRPDAQRMKQRA